MSDKKEKTPSLTTERCRDCYYAGHLDNGSGLICCDYILIEGEMRGCPAGDDCKRFRPEPRPNHLIRDRFRRWQMAQ